MEISPFFRAHLLMLSWKCKNPFQSNEKLTVVHLRGMQNKVERKSFEALQYTVFIAVLEWKLNKAKYCYVITNFHEMEIDEFPFNPTPSDIV